MGEIYRKVRIIRNKMLGYPELLNTHELLFIKNMTSPPSHKIISMLVYHEFVNFWGKQKRILFFIFSVVGHIKLSNEKVFK